VQTLERAAALLRRAISPDGVAAILMELGFPEPLLPLDSEAIAALGFPASVRTARIAQGSGALRGLALELDDSGDTRETLTRVASALARNASQLLWLVIASRASGAEAAIVCWRSDRTQIRIASALWRADRVAQSDAETLCTLAAVGADSDLLTHARWLDVLGREAITSRFFRNLQRVITDLGASLTGRIDTAERRDLALLYVSRLIFLCFLETKGWLNGDFSFLANGYSRCIDGGGRYQRRVLEPLFFGTLNTIVATRSVRAREFGRIPFLNGGLFSRSHLEKQRRASVFSDESFGNAYASLFSHYRFSGREDSAEWSEASIDPEILGKAFEALMGSADRKKSGAFYTPQDLVGGLTSHALGSVMRCRSECDAPLDSLRGIKVLDPACGSGAFLVHVLERLATLRRAGGESGSVSEIRRRVLTDSIFGVDLSPMAVWLCELRLWLSIVVESEESDPMRIPPLPNLDRNIRVGDALAGVAFGNPGGVSTGRKLAALRGRYIKAIGPRKLTLARALDRMERTSAIDVLAREVVRLTRERKGMLAIARARDLFGLRHPPDPQTRIRLEGIRRGIRQANQKRKTLREGAALPFTFGAVFSDIASGGGFDLVLGNPPWVRIHRIAEASRQLLRQGFTVYRRAAWESGAAGAGAGRGFAAQIDLAALFVERGADLLRPGGTMAYLLPSKLWRSLAGGGVRELLLDRADIVLIEDLAGSRSRFDAAVYPSLLVARLRDEEAKRPADAAAADPSPPPDRITIRIRSDGTTRSWRCPPHRLSVDGTPGSPWLLVPGTVRNAFDYVTRSAAPLRISRFGRPLLGVKTGCNDAYLLRVDSVEANTARVSAGERLGEIEREMLRPVIRGETLAQWSLTGRSEYVVWTHLDDGTSRRELPPLARRWLWQHRNTLSKRTDLHQRGRWWSLFRTESAAFDRPRVIWADFGLRPRAIAIAEGEPFVALNTCYVLPCPRLDDAHALAAILNGPLAAAWLNAIAEPARGGYRRYLGWTMAMMPTPIRWNRARKILGPLGERAMEGDIPSDDELLGASLDAYRLTARRVQPLLSWNVDRH
jgi:N-6 DNA Methylase